MGVRPSTKESWDDDRGVLIGNGVLMIECGWLGTAECYRVGFAKKVQEWINSTWCVFFAVQC